MGRPKGGSTIHIVLRKEFSRNITFYGAGTEKEKEMDRSKPHVDGSTMF